MEKKVVKLELTEEEASEVATSLSFMIDTLLLEYGIDEYLTRSIKVNARIVDELVKQVPNIINYSIFPRDIWERCKQVIEGRGTIPAELRERRYQGDESRERVRTFPVNKELEKKTREELANEMVEFIEKKGKGAI
ncbi:MAG: hypothetical protein ACTSXC_04375 [Candidatus Freyarchaeota archaeon]